MKLHSIALAAALSFAFSASSFAATVITCRVTAQSPSHSAFEDSAHVFQFTHFDDGHVIGGLAASIAADWTQSQAAVPGPVSVIQVQDGYRYAFKLTQVSPRKYGNDCGLDDEEANEGQLWDDVTYATKTRERATYYLTVNLADPSRSHLSATSKQDCYGGLSFLGKQGHWSLSDQTEESAECVVHKL